VPLAGPVSIDFEGIDELSLPFVGSVTDAGKTAVAGPLRRVLVTVRVTLFAARCSKVTIVSFGAVTSRVSIFDPLGPL
jgi:hypothetical protein